MKSTNYEKNRKLLERYLKDRDEASLNELFDRNRPLVKIIVNSFVKINSKYFNNYREDLLQIGYIGLYKAITSFSIEKIDSVSFSTYVYTCVKNELIRELRKMRKDVPIKYHFEDYAFGKYYDLNKDFIGCDIVNENIHEMCTFGESIEDDNNSIDKVIEKEYENYKKKVIAKSIDNLNVIEKTVVELFYGLNGENPISKNRIAVKLSTSEATVNKILKSVNSRLAIELKEFAREYNFSKTQGKAVKRKIETKEFLIDKYDDETVKKSLM